MIENKEIAKQINSLMLDTQAKIAESIFLIKENCTNEEFETYRKACAKVLGYILLDILNPLYALHPDIKPKELNEEEDKE